MEQIEKAQALRVTGKTVAEIAIELGVHKRTVNKWFEKFPATTVNANVEFDGDVPSNMSELVSTFEAIVFNQAARLGEHSKSTSMSSHHQLGQLVKIALMVQSLKIEQDTDEPISDEDVQEMRNELLRRVEGLVDQKVKERASQIKPIWGPVTPRDLNPKKPRKEVAEATPLPQVRLK